MMRKLLSVVGAVGILMTSVAAEAKTTLRIGTVAPGGSAWAKQFDKWAEDVRSKTNGEVDIQFKYSQADEAAIVGQIRAGGFEGGAVTAVGLSQIYPDILVFQMPGLWPEDTNAGWKKLNNARTQLRGDLDSAFAQQGFTIVGWGDVGVGRIMSTNDTEIKVPGDLAGQTGPLFTGDQVGPTLFSKFGMSSKPTSVGELIKYLKDGTVKVINAPPLAAVNLQWSSLVTNVNSMTVGYGIGAIVMSSGKISGLSEDQKKTLLSAGSATGDSLTDSIHKADDGAWGYLKSRKKVYAPSDADKAQWRTKFAEIREQLRQSTFKGPLYGKVVGLAQ